MQDPYGHRWSMSSEHSDKKPVTESDEYRKRAETRYPT